MIQGRKNPRLRGYDYRTNGDYFVTICTQDYRTNLCRITQDGQVILSIQGEICQKWIELLTQHYQDISIPVCCIMPNHIHLILRVEHPIAQEDAETIKAYPRLYDYIGWLKYNITKEIPKDIDFEDQPFFQRSFYDHIIRNAQDYADIEGKILSNPSQWKQDCYHPDILFASGKLSF